MNPGHPDISIVIVNYNAAAQLKQCLASIAAHAGNVDVETIVVDNASADDSTEMVRTLFPDVVLIANAENVGYTKANNAGMEVARGDQILLLNNDTEIMEGSLEKLLAYSAEHPEVGAVAPQLLNPDMSMQGNVKRFPTAAAALFGRKSLLTRLFPNNRWSRQYLIYLDQDMSEPFEADFASTAGLLVRREVLATIGLFDPEFFCYWSDADLCHRIHDAGWSIMCVPSAQIIHFEGMGGTRAARRSWLSIVDFNRGAYLYYVKNQLRHPWSPMRLIALLGLSLNALLQVTANRVSVFMASSVSVKLNPAETPAADRAIKGLSAVAVLLIVLVAIVQTQSAAGLLPSPPAAAEASTPGDTPPSQRIDAIMDVESLSAEVQANPTVAAALLPQGDAAPRLEGGEDEATPLAEPPRPTMARVSSLQPEAHDYGLTTYPLSLTATTTLASGTNLDAKIALLQELGVDTVRMDFRWPLIEPTDDDWQLGPYDAAIAKLDAAGIEVAPVVVFTPVWASSAPPGAEMEAAINYPPASLDEYTEFVSHIAAHYSGTIEYWQLGVEPDLEAFWRPEPDPEAFTKQFAAGAKAVRAVDPSAKIVYPGVTTAEKLVFLEETLKLGVADSADVFAIHDYDNSPEGKLREDTAHFVSLLRRYSSEPKEAWCTEVGWSTYTPEEGSETLFIDGVTEDEQRDNLVKRWTILRDLPMERAYTWQLADTGSDPSLLLENLGLVHEDLTPKPAFLSAREVLPMLDGDTSPLDALVQIDPLPDTLETHVFETADDRLVLALWDRNDRDHVLDVRLATDDFVEPERVDLDGGPPVAVGHTTSPGEVRLANLSVDGAPTVLVFSRPELWTDPHTLSPNGDGVHDSTEVGFTLAATQTVSLEVLDSAGAVVRTLVNAEARTPGEHAETWLGDDDAAGAVADGTYTVRLSAGTTSTENLVVVDTDAPTISDVDSELDIRTPDDDRPYVFLPLTYNLSEPAHVTVDVFDESGEFYLQLESHRMQGAGRNHLEWPISAFAHLDGWFWYRVTARDAAGNVISAESKRPLHVDITNPEVEELTCAPQTFSPNADGLADTTTLRYRLAETAEVVALVRNAEGTPFYLYAVRDQAPGAYRYEWTGRAYDPESETLVGLPDGSYTLEVAAFDNVGNTSVATTTVAIKDGDFTGPRIADLRVAPGLISPDGDGVADIADAAFTIDEPASVLLTVESRTGERYAIGVMDGLDAGAHSLAWNASVPAEDGGRTFLPTGGYTLVATATDRNNNTSSARTSFFVEAPDPFAPEVFNALIAPSAISPNGDGVRDVADVSFDLGERADIVVFVVDADGKRYDIYGQQGLDEGTHEFEWFGSGHDRTRGEQVTLPNGWYDFCIESSDRLGNVGRHWGEVRIAGVSDLPLAVTDTSVKHVARAYPAPDGRDRMLRFEYSLTRRADVQIALRSSSGRHYYVGAFPGQAPGEHTLLWDGTAHDPVTENSAIIGDGTYVYLIEAVSGSLTPVTASGRVAVDIRGPR